MCRQQGPDRLDDGRDVDLVHLFDVDAGALHVAKQHGGNGSRYFVDVVSPQALDVGPNLLKGLRWSAPLSPREHENISGIVHEDPCWS